MWDGERGIFVRQMTPSPVAIVRLTVSLGLSIGRVDHLVGRGTWDLCEAADAGALLSALSIGWILR